MYTIKMLNMQHKILFLLKNGIGFGHFRRALVIADDLRKMGHKVFFITQAKSTDLFIDKGFTVFNIPFMHRLPSNLSELFLKQLINKIVLTVDPYIVVEDTDPDSIYDQIPSLRYCRKVLIMRRIEEDALVSMLANKKFAKYDRVIFLQPKQELFNDVNNPKLRLWLEFSQKVVFAGPVFCLPDKKDVQKIIEKYGKDDLIVFNAGAGGEHFGEGFCKKLFETAVMVAPKLKHNRIVIVKGSNYQDDVIVPDNIKNVTVVDYEPLMPALFNVAKICVLRPGYNAVFESLAGKANLLLIPSVSYLEQQEMWIKQLQTAYANVSSITKDYSAETLSKELKQIVETPQKVRKLSNNSQIIAKHIVASDKFIGGIPLLVLTENQKLPANVYIDKELDYGNNTPVVNFYVNKNKKYDNRKANLEERAVLGIPVHKVSSEKELEFLILRNPFKPLAVFSKSKLKTPKCYNRIQVTPQTFSSIVLEDLL